MKDSLIKIAVFDIDGTIFRSSLAVELIHALVENGIFPKKAGEEIETDYQAWLNRQGSYGSYLSELINVFLKYLPGKKENDIKKLSGQILEEQKGHVYRYTRDLVHDLKKKNYRLLAVSGSPDFLVNNFAKTLKFDASFGTEFVIEKGYFTGGVISIGDTNKLQTLKDYAENNNLKINWKVSVAVGDTKSDLSMLEGVGKPIAFNPNLELATIAQKRNWPIVVERKDVIYTLKNFKISSK